jgi:phosphate uptake regulator
METRKLQEVGGGTFTVSIPKEWALEHSLEAGNTVELYTIGDDAIVVKSADASSDSLAEAHVELDGADPELVGQVLRSAHGAGFERVTLASTDSFPPATRRAVRETVGDLVGAEIVAQSETELTVRSLLDPSTVSVDRSLVQLQSIALSIQRTGTTAVVEADTDARGHLETRHAEAVRLRDMITRHLARSLGAPEKVDTLRATQQELFEWYLGAERLERVASDGVRLATVGAELDDSLSEEMAREVRRIAEMTRRLVDDATTALVGDAPLDSANGILDRHATAREDITAAEDALLETACGHTADETTTAVAVARALDCFERTADHGRDIVEVALRSAVRQRND